MTSIADRIIDCEYDQPCHAEQGQFCTFHHSTRELRDWVRKQDNALPHLSGPAGVSEGTVEAVARARHKHLDDYGPLVRDDALAQAKRDIETVLPHLSGPAVPDALADAWDMGRNSGAADAAVIIRWGLQGARVDGRPVSTPNPYRTPFATEAES